MASKSVKSLCQVHRVLNTLLRCQSTSTIPTSISSMEPPAPAKVVPGQLVQKRAIRKLEVVDNGSISAINFDAAAKREKLEKKTRECALKNKAISDALASQLASLHQQEDCVLVHGSFVESVTCWIQRLPARDMVYVQASLRLPIQNACQNVREYGSEQELGELLREESPSGRSFIVYDLSRTDSVVDVAGQRAVLVGCDLHGMVHNTHTMRAYINASANQPMLVHSSFDNMIGQNTMCYVCGPSEFLDWYSQGLSENQSQAPGYLIARIQQLLNNSELHEKVCENLLKNEKLRDMLHDVSLHRVSHGPLLLCLGITDPSMQRLAREFLKNEGFPVRMMQPSDITYKSPGLQVSLSSVTPHSLERLTSALEATMARLNHVTSRDDVTLTASQSASEREGGHLRSYLDEPCNASIYAATSLYTNSSNFHHVNPKFHKEDMALLADVFLAPYESTD